MISAEQSRSAIRSRLSRSSPVDDDVTLVVSDLSIDLADPFSAKLFKVPARGSTCAHIECFNLDNWLAT